MMMAVVSVTVEVNKPGLDRTGFGNGNNMVYFLCLLSEKGKIEQNEWSASSWYGLFAFPLLWAMNGYRMGWDVFLVQKLTLLPPTFEKSEAATLLGFHILKMLTQQ